MIKFNENTNIFAQFGRLIQSAAQNLNESDYPFNLDTVEDERINFTYRDNPDNPQARDVSTFLAEQGFIQQDTDTRSPVPFELSVDNEHINVNVHYTE